MRPVTTTLCCQLVRTPRRPLSLPARAQISAPARTNATLRADLAAGAAEAGAARAKDSPKVSSKAASHNAAARATQHRHNETPAMEQPRNEPPMKAPEHPPNGLETPATEHSAGNLPATAPRNPPLARICRNRRPATIRNQPQAQATVPQAMVSKAGKGTNIEADAADAAIMATAANDHQEPQAPNHKAERNCNAIRRLRRLTQIIS
jgi:hypothetical protein